MKHEWSLHESFVFRSWWLSKGGVVNYNIATCLAHEQVKELESLMNK